VQVVEARPTISGTGEYEFTIINHATGHAQVKLFGVCLSNTTNTVLGHSHSIQFTPSSGLPLFGNTNFGTGGYHEAGSQICPIGTQPTSPGFKFLSSNGRVVKSEQVHLPDGSSYWVFGFVLDYPATVQVSIRCMHTSLGGPGNAGHTHDLQLKEIFRNVSVAPGTSVHRLDCGTYASDAKGITATYDFDSRMTLAGTTPQPIIRDFTFFNPSAGPLGAHIDLICLRMHTGPAHSIHAPLTNTASVQGPNPDPDSSNDSDSVAVTVDANDPPGFAASLGLASAATLSAGDDGAVTVKADCGKAAACTGTIALRAKVRRGHGGKNWAVVAGGPLNAAAGASATLKLPLTARGARKLSSWRNDRSVIAETTLAGAGEPVTHRLRLKRP